MITDQLRKSINHPGGSLMICRHSRTKRKTTQGRCRKSNHHIKPDRRGPQDTTIQFIQDFLHHTLHDRASRLQNICTKQNRFISSW